MTFGCFSIPKRQHYVTVVDDGSAYGSICSLSALLGGMIAFERNDLFCPAQQRIEFRSRRNAGEIIEVLVTRKWQQRDQVCALLNPKSGDETVGTFGKRRDDLEPGTLPKEATEPLERLRDHGTDARGGIVTQFVGAVAGHAHAQRGRRL
ncbi:MAG TPA: hypothetical protein VHD14_02110 [Pseudolabrys sp.]|nr:hypothetical protein [Pseudolabrys sp.]